MKTIMIEEATKEMASNPIYALYRAIDAGDAAEVTRLLSEGFPPHAAHEGENSPLILASDAGNDAIVRLLLKYGAKVNYQSESGETALSAAVVSGHLAVVQTLMNAGADPTIEDVLGGGNALDFAVFYKQSAIEEYLKARLYQKR